MNIEEIAFKNVEELICLRNISLLAIIDFLQKDRKECLNQFAKTHNESVEILKENKELKKQLHDASIQIQELIERDIWCPSNCEKLEKLQRENKKNKEQLEEINKMIEKCGFVNIEQVMLSYCGLIAQQKEFIKWLEDKIQQQETVIAENQETSYFLIYEDEKEDLKLSSQKAYIRRIILEEILSKYKEIIGVSNEKDM